MLSIIAAVSENGVIGFQGKLPWHMPSDLKRFKHYTVGKSCVMGRKTFESLPRGFGGIRLPGRMLIALSRSGAHVTGAHVTCRNLTHALEWPHHLNPEIMLIGGETVFRCALGNNLVDRLYLTRVHVHVRGDTRFPEIDWGQWSLSTCTDIRKMADDEFPSSFEVWTRS